jgi:hypothetical protein
MKIPGLIMAFYLLLLAAMPCSDSEECEIQAKTTEQTNHNGHEDEEEEGCTPFCICACCPTHIYVSDLLTDNFCTPAFSVSSSEIKTEIRSFISHAIWQPPRSV